MKSSVSWNSTLLNHMTSLSTIVSIIANRHQASKWTHAHLSSVRHLTVRHGFSVNIWMILTIYSPWKFPMPSMAIKLQTPRRCRCLREIIYIQYTGYQYNNSYGCVFSPLSGCQRPHIWPTYFYKHALYNIDMSTMPTRWWFDKNIDWKSFIEKHHDKATKIFDSVHM